jgi:phosphoesterase RecJ-like protein
MDGGTGYKETLIKTAMVIDSAQRILIATHRNPDGDAVGSMLGMMHLLGGLGKAPITFCPDGIPKKLWFLPGADNARSSVLGQRFDATVLVDTPDSGLLPAGFPEADKRGVFIIIDHHKRYEVMGDVVVRYGASSVGEIIYDLAISAGWDIGTEAAMCLYTAVVSDTASFKYESATSSSHRVAADLIDKGVNPWRVATELFESFSISRQKLLAEVLATLEVGYDGKYASIYCTRQMMQEAGASNGDLEGMINNARAIEGVALAAFLREMPEGTIRVSLRSKGNVDASQVAERLGGGGHINAGGAYLRDISLVEAVRRVEKEAASVFSSH